MIVSQLEMPVRQPALITRLSSYRIQSELKVTQQQRTSHTDEHGRATYTDKGSSKSVRDVPGQQRMVSQAHRTVRPVRASEARDVRSSAVSSRLPKHQEEYIGQVRTGKLA